MTGRPIAGRPVVPLIGTAAAILAKRHSLTTRHDPLPPLTTSVDVTFSVCSARRKNRQDDCRRVVSRRV